MKRGVILVFLLVLFSIITITDTEAASLTSCSVKSSCSAGETAIASVANTVDAHISKDIYKFLINYAALEHH